MSKPDDISLDLWLTALLVFHKRADETEPEDFPLVERIARAILAERTRATPSRESSDELASLAAKYLGMDIATFRDSTGYAEGYGPECEAILADIKRLAGSVLSQAGGGGVEWDDEDAEEWEPIDTAPKDGSRILLGWEGSESDLGYWMGDASRNYYGKTGWFAVDDDVLVSNPSHPTHWQPLPKPPAAGSVVSQARGDK